MKRNAASQPILPSGLRAHKYIIKPGARPKDIRSAKESYSMPNLLEVLVALAILPSIISNITPIIIATAAAINLPSIDAIIA